MTTDPYEGSLSISIGQVFEHCLFKPMLNFFCKFINAESFFYHSIVLIGCAPFAFSPFDNSMDISRYPGVTIIYNMYSLKKSNLLMTCCRSNVLLPIVEETELPKANSVKFPFLHRQTNHSYILFGQTGCLQYIANNIRMAFLYDLKWSIWNQKPEFYKDWIFSILRCASITWIHVGESVSN